MAEEGRNVAAWGQEIAIRDKILDPSTVHTTPCIQTSYLIASVPYPAHSSKCATSSKLPPLMQYASMQAGCVIQKKDPLPLWEKKGAAQSIGNFKEDIWSEKETLVGGPACLLDQISAARCKGLLSRGSN